MNGRRFKTKLSLNYGTGESFYEGSTGYIIDEIEWSKFYRVRFDDQVYEGDYMVQFPEKYLDIEPENLLNDEDLMI
jgi:hypothetical protein